MLRRQQNGGERRVPWERRIGPLAHSGEAARFLCACYDWILNQLSSSCVTLGELLNTSLPSTHDTALGT